MQFISLRTSARRRGISLIEGVLYLVIALAVIVGGIVFFQQAQESSKIDATTRGMAAMLPATLNLSQEGDLSDLDGANIPLILHKAGFLTEGSAFHFDETNEILEHAWGGEFWIGSNMPTDPAGLRLELVNIPKSVCLRVGEQMMSISEASGLSVRNMTVSEGRNATVINGRPTPADLGAACPDEGTIMVYLDK